MVASDIKPYICPNTIITVPATRRMRRCPASYTGPVMKPTKRSRNDCRLPIQEIWDEEAWKG
jgi:hypothetical protein